MTNDRNIYFLMLNICSKLKTTTLSTTVKISAGEPVYFFGGSGSCFFPKRLRLLIFFSHEAPALDNKLQIKSKN